MNLWQVLQQIRFLLRDQAWTGSSTFVFNSDSVRITVGPEMNVMGTGLIPPVALIRPLEAVSDPLHDEEPDLLECGIGITLITLVGGDSIGESALMGANRAGQTDSRNRGLLELEEEMFNAVEWANTIDGVEIRHRATGAAFAEIDEGSNYIAWRDYEFKAKVTADRFYHPVTNFTATGGAGQVVLAWDPAPVRFDRFRYVVRRASGAAAPATASDGTGVILGSNLVTSVTDSGLGAGTYSYSIFCQYDETNATPAQADRTSAATPRTSVTVT